MDEKLFREIKQETLTHNDHYMKLWCEIRGIQINDSKLKEIRKAKGYREFTQKTLARVF